MLCPVLEAGGWVLPPGAFAWDSGFSVFENQPDSLLTELQQFFAVASGRLKEFLDGVDGRTGVR